MEREAPRPLERSCSTMETLRSRPRRPVSPPLSRLWSDCRPLPRLPTHPAAPAPPPDSWPENSSGAMNFLVAGPHDGLSLESKEFLLSWKEEEEEEWPLRRMPVVVLVVDAATLPELALRTMDWERPRLRRWSACSTSRAMVWIIPIPSVCSLLIDLLLLLLLLLLCCRAMSNVQWAMSNVQNFFKHTQAGLCSDGGRLISCSKKMAEEWIGS